MSRPPRPIPEAPAILDTLFETSAIALAYCDRELRYVRVTQAFAEIDGIAQDEHGGRPVTGGELVAACRRAIGAGEFSTGIEIWDEWVADAYPVKDAQGAVLGVALVVESREREHERAHRFLARASALL